MHPTRQHSASAVSELAVRRIREHIQNGLDLAGRQAVYSAQEEFIQANRLVAGELDLASGGREHRAALDEGLRMIDSLDCRQCSEQSSDATSSAIGATELRAMQDDLMAAQRKLAYAVEHEPTASMALYLLGRAHAAITDGSSGERALAVPKAITLYQTALEVDPTNYLAANELAVTLARCGQLDEARQVLLHALAVAPRPDIWANLAKLCERMGDIAGSREARAQCEALAAKQQAARSRELTQGQSSGPSLRWVEPDEFVRCSGSNGFDDLPAKATPVAQPTALQPAKAEAKLPMPEWIASGFRNLTGKNGAGENR